MKKHNGPAWYLRLLMLVLAVAVARRAAAIKPSPSPATESEHYATNAAAADDNLGNYNVVSSLEIGVRGLSVSGSDNKYRSDLNYSPGVRLFDSSFFLRSKEGYRRTV